MSICPQCGTNNRPQARFCKKCSGSLSSGRAPRCPYCNATLRPGARFCKNCGRPVQAPSTDDDQATCSRCGHTARSQSRFCPNCGAPLSAVSQNKAKKGPRCPNCGALARTRARFCSQCSHPLRSRQAPISSPPQPGRFGTGDLLPTTVLIDRYVIMEKVAQGGMGAIYKAQDKRLQDKIVAVKEMSESAIAPSDRERVLEAFHREAQLLARLRHPNLVRVTDRFQKDERYFMVMEFIPGRTMDEMLKERKARGEPFPEDRVLSWADQLCDVLSYLHNQSPKIIYRDVKPANVMVVKGTDTVKLIDFGITRFYKPGKKKDTIEFGTDGYAPPEQYGKAQTDERSDVYALGVTLHELLTLHDPVTKLFDFPPPRRLNPKVSRRVAKAITKALESSRNDRHQSMEEMREALLGDEVASKTHSPPVPSPSSSKLALTPAVLDFGHVPVGGAAPDRSLQFTSPSGEKVKLSTDASWLHVHPRSVSKRKGQATVTLDTSRLRPGRLTLQGGPLKRWIGWHTRLLVPDAQEQRGHVVFEVNDTPMGDAPVSVTVLPPRWQVYAGWLMTLGAISLETAIIVGGLGLLMLIGW